MFLYKRKDSPNWYIGGILQNGKKRCQALHKFLNLSFPVQDKQTAEILFANLRVKEVRQELGIAQPDSVPIGQFYTEYSRFCDKNKTLSTVRADNYRLKIWLDFLSSQKIESTTQITKTLLNQFIQTCISRSTNATINRHVSLIRASLRWGVRQGHLKENPLRDFSRLTETRLFRPAVITSEDLDKLFSIKDEKFKLFLQIVYYTLARKREVLQLTWEDVDLQRRVILFRQTKIKIPRVIPLSDVLFSILQQVTPKTGKLFIWETEYVSRKFQRLRKRLDIKIQGIHRFRHARASELLQKGANIRDIQTMLGHKTPQTTLKIYAQSYLEGLRETVEL